MHASFPAALPALALLVGATAAAQPRASPCETGTRRIELKAEPPDEAPELCIGPEASTTLLFNGAEVLPGGVSVDGRERFTLVDVGTTLIRLVPSERVVPGERLRLTVRFKAGTAPASAAFWLRVYAGRTEPFVEVYREGRTLASYQQEVQEKDTQLQQCQEDKVQLLAGQQNRGGLTGLLAAGLMSEKGIPPKDILRSIGEHSGNFVGVKEATSYRSLRTVAVELLLWETEDTQAWRAVGASLVGLGRRTLRVHPPWQAEAFRRDANDRRVMIEADATQSESRGSFTLTVWGEDATRSLILTGVTFP